MTRRRRAPDVFYNGQFLLNDTDAPDGHGDYSWEPGKLLPHLAFKPKDGHVLVLAHAGGARDAFVYRGREWLGGVATVVRAIRRLPGVRGVRTVLVRDDLGDLHLLVVTAPREFHDELCTLVGVFVGGTFSSVRCAAVLRVPGPAGDTAEAEWRLGTKAPP